MSVMRDFPDLPPVWMLAHGALAWVAAGALPLVSFAGPVPRTLGVSVAVIGVALAAWAAVWFAARRTTIEPREVPSALIVGGPFRLNRNPIYTGMALVLLGWALSLGALSAVLAVLPFAPIIDRRFVRGEEMALAEAFGGDAARYMEASRRW